MFSFLISFVIFFQFVAIEYVIGESVDDSDSDRRGSRTLEASLVRVTPNGEIIPLHFNPTERNISENPIQVIPKKKIIGGKESRKGAVPYLVSIIVNGRLFCGGSIYNSKTILSAAHCFSSKSGKFPNSSLNKYNYIAGEFDRDDADGNEQKRKGVNVQIHPKYKSMHSYYDIAVVTVDHPFEYNKFVQPLPIDKPPLIPEQVGAAMISGWGYTLRRNDDDDYDKAYYPNTLREANIHVFTKKECLSFYSSYKYYQNVINAGLICGGFKSGQVDACQGDSGGPLACYNPAKRNRRYLCGIVATGIGCGLPNLPGFYTRVSEFHDWVIQIAGYADLRTIDDSRRKIEFT